MYRRGDRVRLGTSDYLKGEVLRVTANGTVVVKWQDDTIIGYREIDLKLMEENLNQQRTKRVERMTRMMVAAVAHSHGSTCKRRATGCVLEREKKTVATGYNGSPHGLGHCIDHGCLMHEGHCINCEHAESNACLQCEGSADTAYCTDKPCLKCLRALLQKGVQAIFYWRDYADPARDVFMEHHFERFASCILVQVNEQQATLLQEVDDALGRLS